ncbi:MAG: hypothetical protein Q9162_003895 [Coniocarpon cinnabarinum]
MARFFSLLASFILFFMTVSARPIPDLGSDIMRRLAAIIRGAQANTVPPVSTLPAPDSTLALKYIAMGLGTQNYTCATSDESSSPKAVGARANLYDATSIMVAAGNSRLGTDNTIMSSGTCAADSNNSAGDLSLIGEHYFDSDSVPTFDLATEKMLLKSQKMNATPAPEHACMGRDKSPAVPWLMLQADNTGRSVGLSQVFRVETAGGNATTCVGMPAGPQGFQLDYAALYYLYGPSS